MEEKVIKQNNKKPTAKKKIYTHPMLTVYGKLTELTASGTMGGKEGKGGNPTTPDYMA